MPWLDCPHGCGVKRQNTEMMEEHVAASHGNVRVVPGSTLTAPGETEAPDDLLNELEAMGSALTEITQIDKDMVMRQQRDSGLRSRDGKLMPEFVTAWRPDGMKIRVHARRMWELAGKGFRFRRPSQAELEEAWFHWRCPLRSCPSHTNICEVHQKPGDDSNHHLKSPEYMIIDHLHSGGKAHRQFFEMHKEELAARYKEAWFAWEAAEEEATKVTERQRDERERGLVAAAAGPQEAE